MIITPDVTLGVLGPEQPEAPLMAWQDDADFTDRRRCRPLASEALQARLVRRALARGEPLSRAVHGAQITASAADLMLWTRLGLRRSDALAPQPQTEGGAA